MWTVPNCITLFRVILIPVFVVVYFLDWRWAHEAGAFIFWLAAITDWFDGYLARKLQQSTPFGAFLDPVADKLIVGAALLMITHSYANLWITLPSIALLVREIYVSALREWMGSNGIRNLYGHNYLLGFFRLYSFIFLSSAVNLVNVCLYKSGLATPSKWRSKVKLIVH